MISTHDAYFPALAAPPPLGMPEPKKPRKRRRSPPKRDAHRPHFGLDRLALYLAVHGQPSPERIDALAGRLGVDGATLRSLCLNLRLSRTLDEALNLVAAASVLSARPARPVPSAPTVRSAAPDQVRLTFAALPPQQQHYARRMAWATRGTA